MPDSQDYADLEGLLASPESWTEAEAEVALSMRRNQAAVIAGSHAKDAGRIESMKAVLTDIDLAIARWRAAR